MDWLTLVIAITALLVALAGGLPGAALMVGAYRARKPKTWKP
jgi:hypothetical protein